MPSKINDIQTLVQVIIISAAVVTALAIFHSHPVAGIALALIAAACSVYALSKQLSAHSVNPPKPKIQKIQTQGGAEIFFAGQTPVPRPRSHFPSPHHRAATR